MKAGGTHRQSIQKLETLWLGTFEGELGEVIASLCALQEKYRGRALHLIRDTEWHYGEPRGAEVYVLYTYRAETDEERESRLAQETLRCKERQEKEVALLAELKAKMAKARGF
jgi:hypothetical protein